MSVSCVLLSGRCFCDELITRPEESYRVWCDTVIRCSNNPLHPNEEAVRRQNQKERKKERKKEGNKEKLHPNNPDSSVGIATDYGLDGPGIESWWGEIFRPSRPALGSTKLPV